MTDDRNFDRMLEEALTELPPPNDQTWEINPWRQAITRVIAGIALTTITLNFWYLNDILPAIGVVLAWLGYRTLRNENKYFKVCWIISIYDLWGQFANLVLNATLYRVEELNPVAVGISLAAPFVQMLCLWLGIRAVRRKAEQPDRAGAVAALMVWYVVLAVLAVLGVQGWLFGLPLLASYFFILRSLLKIPALLDEAGYEVKAAPVGISDTAAWIGWAAALAVCIPLAGFLFSRYPMEWALIDTEEHAGLEKIKSDLLELGMPEQVILDLTAEDLAEMDGATYVGVDVSEHPFNDGRKVSYTTGNSTHSWTHYDVKELKLTNLAVELADGRWKAIHHFYWQVEPKIRGTEAIKLWPAYQRTEGYRLDSELTGRVLYDWEGETYTGDFYSLETEDYTSDSIIFGQSYNSDVFALFSLPRQGERCRGYVAYTVEMIDTGWLFNSWNNYTHQHVWFNYPLMTAQEYSMSGLWLGYSAFDEAQSAIQFHLSELDRES